MKKLSVIIPAYNAAPWLNECINSLLAQTVTVDEIIVVNDGSTDETGAILAAYAAQDCRFTILETKGGEGASVARNLGISVATGEWVGFVDADDWVEPNAYETMLGLGDRENLDMVLVNGRYQYPGCSPDHRIYTDQPCEGVLRGKDWLAHKLENRTLLHMVWLHLYRRSFIVTNNLSFVPGITYEDVIWTTKALLAAGRVSYLDTPLFNYRKLPRRLGDEANDKKMLHIIESSKKNAMTLSDLAEQEPDSRVADLLRWQLVDGGMAIFHRAAKIRNRTLRLKTWKEFVGDGTIRLLWKNSVNKKQKKKIAHRAIRSFVSLLIS